jgi:chromosome segregation ATPase
LAKVEKNEKNTEIEKLNNSYRVLKQELENLHDENLSLKSQLSDSYDDLNKLKYRMNSTGTPIDEGSVSSVQSTDKPIVYLIGTSNIQGIDETKLDGIIPWCGE